MRKYYLTLDVGSTAAKLVIFDRSLHAVYRDERRVPTTEKDGYPHQRAEDWWQAVTKLVRSALDRANVRPEEIAAISSTGQMEDCLLVDGGGDPVTGVYMYSDGRGEEQYQRLLDRFGCEKLMKMTGNNFDQLMSINKYLWLRENRPEEFSRHEHLIMGSKDYINYKMTGVNAIDYTNASTTGFLDFSDMDWNLELIDELNLDRSKLPELSQGARVVGELRSEAANELGLSSGTPVVNGAGDLGASTLGSGVTLDGGVYCYLGTTGWIAKPADELSENENVFSLSDQDGEGYINAGAVLNAGSAYDWYLEEVLGIEDPGSEDYREVEGKLKETPLREEKPIFIPFLRGERSPLRVGEGNGCYLGLDGATGKLDMLKANLEGVGFSLKHNLIEVLGGEKKARELDSGVHLIGGASRSIIWPDLLSDILQLEVITLKLEAAAPSLGAAILARKAVEGGEFCSELSDLFSAEKTFVPNEARAEVLGEKFERYLELVEGFEEGGLFA